MIVAVWLTFSIASVLLSGVTWWQLSKRLEEARLAVVLQDTVDAILKLMLDGETSQRGYAITGDETFLEPMKQSEPQLAMRFDTLTELVHTDRTLLDRVMELRGQAQVLINHHNHIVKVRQEEGESAAAAIIAEGEGKRLMEVIRNLVTGIKSRRGTLISDRGAAQRSQLLRAGLTSLAAGVLGIGAGGFAFFLAVLALRQQRRERKLVEAKLAAERSSQEKTVFLANMSHEIRTPMNAVLGFCELLEGELSDSKHRQYVTAIRTSGRSLLQLINDILDMSKIEAGVLELREEPTDPREICEFTLTLFLESASRKGVKLECHLDEDLPRAILIDRIRLRQVLVNLVGNAVKFTDTGEIKIRVDWEPEKESGQITLLIEVQDTGVGIPRDKQETIFNPFVQAGYQREKEKQGTGLGLSIVKRLSEMMGGEVTVESIPGTGSTFRLRLPHIQLSARLAKGNSVETSEPVNFDLLHPSHLLVVDDHEANRQLMAGLFARSHHRIEFAHNGVEAVQRAIELHPDAILMDIRMPGMDGRDALGEIRKQPGLEMTPVIAVTASTSLSEEEELERKFSGYVRKPFTQRQLFDELAQFLPRIEEETQSAQVSKPPADKSVASVSVPPALAAELRRIQDERWTRLCETLAINECKEFADALGKLAREYRVASLSAYAQSLAQYAESYAVEEMEERLREFPGLVDQLERDSAL